MSSTAPSKQWREAAWATRLIPGSAIARGLRKRPASVDALGHTRTDSVSTDDVPPRSGTVARDLLLPHPVVARGSHRLLLDVAADIALTAFTWVLTAVGAGLLRPVAHAAGASVFARTGSLRAQTLQAAGFSLVFAALITLLGYSEGLYDATLPRTKSMRAGILAKVILFSALIGGASGALLGLDFLPVTWFLAGTVLNYVLLVVGRSLQEESRRKPSRLLNVLIVGAGREGKAVAEYLRQHPEQGRVVRGFLDDGAGRAFGILGRLHDLPRAARAEFADEVIVALPSGHEMIDEVVSQARIQHLDVRIIADFCGLRPEERWIESWDEIPVVTVHRECLPQEALLLKRALDILVASCLLIAAFPFLAVISVLIRLDSPGPALYRASRAGRKGQRFECLKFRTMIVDADARKDALRARNEREGPCFKIAHDPRITRVGAILRRYSFDELPQLWNVLCGEMSLVGPRPHPLDDFARYSLEHLRRLDVTPGLTGLWQVTARRDASFETALTLDLEYIECWNLWLDLRILWQTVAVVLRGTGA